MRGADGEVHRTVRGSAPTARRRRAARRDRHDCGHGARRGRARGHGRAPSDARELGPAAGGGVLETAAAATKRALASGPYAGTISLLDKEKFQKESASF